MVAAGNFVFVAAQSQTGKTLLMFYVARMFIHGGMLFGKYQVHPVPKVLYLVLEDPDRRVKDRLLDTDHEFQTRPEEGQLRFYVAPGLAISNDEMFLYLENLIQSHGYEVVFIDTYQRGTPGISSFDDEKQSLILHRLANLTRITLFVIDHIRKSDNRAKRGALNLDDIKGTGGKAQNADTVILMERRGPQLQFVATSKDFDERIAILVDVAPQGSDGPKFTYVGDIDEMGQGSRKRGQEHLTKVLEMMQPGAWLSCKDIAQATKLAESTTRSHLKTLIDQGRIAEKGGNRDRKYCRIAESGQKPEISDNAKTLWE